MYLPYWEREGLRALGEKYKVTLQLDGVTLSTLGGKKANVFKRRYGASAKKVTSAKVASLVSHASAKFLAGLEQGGKGVVGLTLWRVPVAAITTRRDPRERSGVPTPP